MVNAEAAQWPRATKSARPLRRGQRISFGTLVFAVLQIGNQLTDQAVPAGLALALNLKSKRKHGVVVRMAQPMAAKNDTVLRASSIIDPMRVATFYPVQNARPQRSQRRRVIGKQRETEWQHPESDQREKPQDPAKCQQRTHGNPQPAAGRLPDPMNS
jgi:hypothetical protein